jgi:hypothetical protein
MRNRRPIPFGLLLVGMLLSAAALHAAELGDSNVRLVLERALIQEGGERSDLVLEFQVRGGKLLPGFVRGCGMTQGTYV